MGDVISLYEIEKKKIEKQHTKNGKLSREGISELMKHASRHGKFADEYLPSGYGTSEYEKNHWNVSFNT